MAVRSVAWRHRLGRSPAGRVVSVLGLASVLAFAGAMAGLKLMAGPARPAGTSSRAGLDPARAPGVGAAMPRASRTTVQLGYGRLPLSFEPNQGQVDGRARYLGRGPGYALFLTKRSALLSLAAPDRNGRPARGAVVSIGLAGASPKTTPTGESALPGRINYLLGSDPSRWHTNVPTYGRVLYRGVWPGIDAAFYGTQGRLEFDFDLAAGADPGRIGLSLGGAGSVRVERGGSLAIALAGGHVRLLAPGAYQVVNGARRAVTSRYVVSGRIVRLRLGHYDRRAALVVDPSFVYSTYLGSSLGGNGEGNAIAVDRTGAAYVTGFTLATHFPRTEGAYQQTNRGGYDAFVTKLAPDGRRLVYSTYLGGSDSDAANGIAVDSAGAAYVTGFTLSSNFPTTSGAYQRSRRRGPDAFVTRLAPTGASLAYSTYLGGSGTDRATGIAVDRTGAAYVTGYTDSSNFPTTGGAYHTRYRQNFDAFVTKLARNGRSLAYSTYLGGSSFDYGEGIAVDSTGAAYVTGETGGSLPTTLRAYRRTYSGGNDAFVLELNPVGAKLVYATYLGGSDIDYAKAIAVDSTGAAYVAGYTRSSDFPTTPRAPQRTHSPGDEAFATKLAPAGTHLIYSTYLSGTDRGAGIAVDATHAAYVTGETSSHDLPTTPGAPGRAHRGWSDAFVTKLAPSGTSLQYSTYLGGSHKDAAKGIAVYSSGIAYVTGWTTAAPVCPRDWSKPCNENQVPWDNDFPTTPNAYQTNQDYRGFTAFVTKFSGVTRPYAYTYPIGPILSVYWTFAIIGGEVNPNDAYTSYRFEYGTSTSYGASTPWENVGLDSADHSFYRQISDLQPNTTYHYRIVAKNAVGTTDGGDQTFTTLPPQP